MAAKTIFINKTCDQCVAWFRSHRADYPGECRMKPPAVLNEYTSTYPKVREHTEACYQFIMRPRRK